MESRPCATRGVHVLSVQSHTVASRVGNRAAELPLTLLGAEVSALPTVSLAAHAAYPHNARASEPLSPSALDATLNALRLNLSLQDLSHLLSGYIGSEPFALRLSAAVDSARASSSLPHVEYVCDPVLGDDDRLYVPSGVVDAFKHHLLPRANVVLPNAFEAEQLTGIRVDGNTSIISNALDSLHALGPSTAIITSIASSNSDELLVAASTTDEQDDGLPRKFCVSLHKRDVKCTGTGDMLSALVLGWRAVHRRRLADAVRLALGGVQAAIRFNEETQSNAPPAETDAELWRRRELQIVAAQDQIATPPDVPEAQPL
jgi:pyridoxine kinase